MAIPLAAMLLPIVLLVVAVLVDLVALAWMGYRFWRDEWSGPMRQFILVHTPHPGRWVLAHLHHPFSAR
ncbi:MAG TPA: hypothetical protein VLE53_10990 [Gemmatimonadaceae bacterium]|nr:hypothetical protein [Gemmatimonadaceae bacterium]